MTPEAREKAVLLLESEHGVVFPLDYREFLLSESSSLRVQKSGHDWDLAGLSNPRYSLSSEFEDGPFLLSLRSVMPSLSQSILIGGSDDDRLWVKSRAVSKLYAYRLGSRRARTVAGSFGDWYESTRKPRARGLSESPPTDLAGRWQPHSSPTMKQKIVDAQKSYHLSENGRYEAKSPVTGAAYQGAWHWGRASDGTARLTFKPDGREDATYEVLRLSAREMVLRGPGLSDKVIIYRRAAAG